MYESGNFWKGLSRRWMEGSKRLHNCSETRAESLPR